MLNYNLIFLFFIIQLMNISYGLNILMTISFQGYSHVTFMNKIADVLIDGGHNLTILDMPVSPYVPITGNKRATRVIHYKTKNVDYGYYGNMTSVIDAFQPNRKYGKDLPNLYKQRYLVCQEMVQDDQLIQELNQTKYDIGIAEIVEICHEGFFELLGIKTVVHTSAVVMFSTVYHVHGIPEIPSFMPHLMLPLSTKMSYSERIWNLFFTIKSNRVQNRLNNEMTQLFRNKYGSKFPDLSELVRQRASYIFLNNNVHLDFPNLLTSRIKYIGGLESKHQYEPISEHLHSIINKYKGFIIFSFGSIMRTSAIPEHVKRSVTAAFKEFPDYAILWKYDKKTEKNWSFVDGAKNIYFEDWLPQKSLLNHPKCKVFISHVGYNSFQESILAGTPIIAVPMFSDQMHQAAVIDSKKLGVYLTKENFNHAHLSKILKEMLDEKPSIYHLQAKKFAERIRDDMIINPPDKVILKYVEFAAKHGSMPDMNLSTIDLPFYQLYLLDILIILGIVLIFIIGLIIVILKSIFKKFTTKKLLTKKEKRQ